MGCTPTFNPSGVSNDSSTDQADHVLDHLQQVLCFPLGNILQELFISVRVKPRIFSAINRSCRPYSSHHVT